MFENFALIAPINIIEIRDRFDLSSGIDLLARVEFTERDEILRFLERERPQQDGVDHAEHCGVGSNPERECQNDNRSEERLFGKDSESVTEILHTFYSLRSAMIGSTRDARRSGIHEAKKLA